MTSIDTKLHPIVSLEIKTYGKVKVLDLEGSDITEIRNISAGINESNHVFPEQEREKPPQLTIASSQETPKSLDSSIESFQLYDLFAEELEQKRQILNSTI